VVVMMMTMMMMRSQMMEVAARSEKSERLPRVLQAEISSRHALSDPCKSYFLSLSSYPRLCLLRIQDADGPQQLNLKGIAVLCTKT
jgi:hypothetical protein